jgi:RNA polymerase sigma factor (sigma-70 family)
MNQEIITEDMVLAAQRGDPQAWNMLVQHYTPLLWSITRSARLPDADANDVIQTTWLRCLEHLGQLRSPTELGGWLATTARRETIRLQRQAPSQRSEPAAAEDSGNRTELERPSSEDLVLQAERRDALLRALAQLPAPCRHLLQLMTAEPPANYAEISAALGVPVGSIGPTRARCLQRLRRLLALAEGDTPSAAMPTPVRGTASAGTIASEQGEDVLESLRELKTSTVPRAVMEEARRNVTRQPAAAATAALVSDSAVMPHGLGNPASEAVRLLRFRGANCEINLEIRNIEAMRSVNGQLDPPQRAHIWVESEIGVRDLNVAEPTGFSIHEIPTGLVCFHIQTPDGDQFSTDWVTI